MYQSDQPLDKQMYLNVRKCMSMYVHCMMDIYVHVSVGHVRVQMSGLFSELFMDPVLVPAWWLPTPAHRALLMGYRDVSCPCRRALSPSL